MKKLLITLFCALIFCVTASAQDRQCDTVDECNALVVRLSQALEKTLDVNKAQTDVMKAQADEIESRKRKGEIDAAIIERQTELIKILEKDRRKQISFMFGLLKIRL